MEHFLPGFEALDEQYHHLKDTTAFRLSGWALSLTGVCALFAGYVLFPKTITSMLSVALFLSPVWLPAILVTGAWELWLTMRRSQFIASQDYILLEIKVPRSIIKTPLAMETFLSTIHLTKGESTWWQKYVQGSVRPYWSLEIASFEGKVHFFIWTRSAFRRIVESAFYAQYPGAQLVEVPDYTRQISADPKEWSVWGCDYKHVNKDPFPIKTYIDYGLDKIPNEENEQVDPMANIIEFMSSLGKGEYLWLQIIIRVTGHEKFGFNEKGEKLSWKDQGKEIVNEIREKTRSTFTDAQGIEQPGFPNPTKGQSETMAAIERNISKLAYDVGMRSVYISKSSSFNPITITGMIYLMKPFNSETLNAFKATRWGMEFNDYPWELTLEQRKDVFRKEIVDAYRRRQYYHPPHGFNNYMIMSTEELATIFHIPTRAVETPGLPRIQSATATAPSNLPT